MRISILIPCHNEELSIRKCVQSCIDQTRKADEIVVVNDGSTDRSGEILAEFGNQIKVVTIPKATGNKSYAQQHGLQHITGDVFIATDGDSLLDKDFVRFIEEDFLDDRVAAVGGYVNSLPHNWLTACRGLEYTIGQNIHKLAQSYMDFVLVIPGVAGAFRTSVFREHIHFDHDTITEDLDFTYKFNKLGLGIIYDRRAISYTQDPARLSLYINQMRRWYGGGYQNLKKHFDIMNNPVKALELSLMYLEGLAVSISVFMVPLINLRFTAYLLAFYVITIAPFSVWAAVRDHRADFLLVPFSYLIIIFINAYLFLEQFVKEVLFRRKNLIWFQPERVGL